MTQTIATAKVRGITDRELVASGGAYVAGDVVVIIPAVLLTVGNPKMGDQAITTDGQVYTVLPDTRGGKRDQSAQPRTWRLVTRNLSIAFDLRDTISIQRPSLMQDNAGGVMRGWPDNNVPGVRGGGSTPYQSISARVQQMSKDEAEERGIRGLQEAYTVILDRQVQLAAEDRVKVERWTLGGTPIYLDIRRVLDVGKIDELPKLECVRAL